MSKSVILIQDDDTQNFVGLIKLDKKYVGQLNDVDDFIRRFTMFDLDCMDTGDMIHMSYNFSAEFLKAMKENGYV